MVGFESSTDLRNSEYAYDSAMMKGLRRKSLSSDHVIQECPENGDFLKQMVAVDKEDEYQDDGHGGSSSSSEDLVVDPEIMLFLEHLKEDKNSYVFEMNGHRVKYEEEEEGEEEEEEEEQLEDDHHHSEERGKHAVGMKENRKRGRGYRDEMPRSQSKKASSNSSSSGKGDFGPFLQGCNDQNDESYISFLKQLRIDGDILVMESDEGIVKYEKENHEDPMDTDLPLNNTKGVESDEDDGDSVEILNSVDPVTEFEENLRKVLDVEYSDQELVDKYKEARNHKQMERRRDLRGRLVSYPTEHSSFSYLDYYPELRHMIRLAHLKSNRVRMLALLRCLFFYLKNLSHEGAFMPWRKESALKMIRDLGGLVEHD